MSQSRRCPFLFLPALFFISFTLLAAKAGELPPVSGKPILQITGAIQHMNSEQAAHLDAEQLLALEQIELSVTTPWTDGETRFAGPRLRDVLRLVGASGRVLKAVALNDYAVDIPVSDAENYPVILALHMNGKRLRVRDKGPLWVIYPWGDFAELRTETVYSRSIWQLKELRVNE